MTINEISLMEDQLRETGTVVRRGLRETSEAIPHKATSEALGWTTEEEEVDLREKIPDEETEGIDKHSVI